MYQELANKFWGYLSGERAKQNTENIWEKDRFSSADKSLELSQWYQEEIKKIGLEEAEPIVLPANGETSFAGILIPKCWQVKEAIVKLLIPEERLLADYQTCPCSLMLYSSSTPPEGVTAQLIAVEKDNFEKDLQGKVVFTRHPDPDSLKKRGAIGIISDWAASYEKGQDKYEPKLKDGIQWHNFTINPFRERLWGISVSPSLGKDLRRMFQEKKELKVFAKIRTKTYPGELLLPTGVIPGKIREEVFLTGHLFEQGANDNASGCGLGLEIFRCLQEMITKNLLPQPRRTIRLLPSFECRGLQAYAYLYRSRVMRTIAGLDLDTVGSTNFPQRKVNLHQNFSANPAYPDYLLAELFHWLSKRIPSLRWQTAGEAFDDNQLGEPLINAPTPVVGISPHLEWHTSLDTPDTVDAETLKGIGVVAATYLYFIANAADKEAEWLADLIYRQLRRERPTKHRAEKFLKSILRLTTKKGRQRLKEKTGKLLTNLKLQEEIFPQPASQLEKEANTLLPKKNFIGFVGFDDLNTREREEYFKINGQLPWWISPCNLNFALFFSNGKRSLYQIWHLIKKAYDLEKLIKNFLFLEKKGLVLIRRR